MVVMVGLYFSWMDSVVYYYFRNKKVWTASSSAKFHLLLQWLKTARFIWTWVYCFPTSQFLWNLWTHLCITVWTLLLVVPFLVSIKLRGVKDDGKKDKSSGHVQLHSTLWKFYFLSYSLVIFAFAKTWAQIPCT